eukprot:CAMPEP_0178387316 /NCGR_PEP_ID=MMETSP0689_2-20121128/9011_1 /TAXON_ID=160604 /ORGANISM="Amphidinium massartii, Strain CS-259" /LENGTH=941 /DNA_ID=CAMNT_0020007677 /DNA_START=39 /DNA_END=2860 /DNA_ORIENTATION=-
MSSVAFRQQVVIQNARLHMLYLILLALFVVIILTKFLIFEAWSGDAQVEGQVRLRVAGTQNHTALVQAFQSHMVNSSFCTQPAQFDQAPYVDHQCMPICPAGIAQLGCIHPSELVVGSHEMYSAFLVTHMQDRRRFVSGLQVQEEVSSYFVPSVDALSLTIQFSYSEPPRGSKREVTFFWSEMTRVAGSSVPVVVLSQSGGVYRVFEPGEKLLLSLQEVLDLSGVNLDAVSAAASDIAEGSTATNRLVGVALELRIDCYDGDRGNPLDDELSGSRCYLMLVDNTPPSWVERRTEAWTTDAITTRITHGISIEGRVGGDVRKVDWNQVFFELVTAAVLMRAPKAIVLFVTIGALGRLSKIYRAAIYKRFMVEDQCGGMLSRLMCKVHGFAAVSDIKYPEFSLSKARLQTQVEDELERKQANLEEQEAHMLVNITYRAAHTSSKSAASLVERKNCCAEIADLCAETVQDFLRETLDELGMLAHNPEANTQEKSLITFDNFERTGSSSDPINFDSLLLFFDGSHHRTCVESALMPTRLKMGMDNPEELRGKGLVRLDSHDEHRRSHRHSRNGWGFSSSEGDDHGFNSSAGHQSASTSSWTSGGSRGSRPSLTAAHQKLQVADRRQHMLEVHLEEVEKNLEELSTGLESLKKLLKQRQDFFASGDNPDNLRATMWFEKQQELESLCAGGRTQAKELIKQTVDLEAKIKQLQDHSKRSETAWSKCTKQHAEFVEKVINLERVVFDDEGAVNHEGEGRQEEPMSETMSRDSGDGPMMMLTQSLNHLRQTVSTRLGANKDLNARYDVHLENLDSWSESDEEHAEPQEGQRRIGSKLSDGALSQLPPGEGSLSLGHALSGHASPAAATDREGTTSSALGQVFSKVGSALHRVGSSPTQSSSNPLFALRAASLQQASSGAPSAPAAPMQPQGSVQRHVPQRTPPGPAQPR